jgi:hypothetical protein
VLLVRTTLTGNNMTSYTMSQYQTSACVSLCAVTHPPCSMKQRLGCIANCILISLELKCVANTGAYNVVVAHFHDCLTMRSHPSTVLVHTEFRLYRELHECISRYPYHCSAWQVQVKAKSSSYTSTSVSLCAVTHSPRSLARSLGCIVNCIAAGDKGDSILQYVILGGG